MKILLAIAFVIICFVFTWVSLQLHRLNVQSLLSNKRDKLKLYGYSLVIQLLFISTFGILSLFLPIKIVLFTIAIMFIAFILWELFVEAVTGINIPEFRDKITFLTLFEGFKKEVKKPNQLQFSTQLIGGVVLLSWLTALIIFLINPLESEGIRATLALFTIVVPILSGSILQIVNSAPAITAPYIDDDVRNVYLLRNIPEVINSTIWLLFPVWIIYTSQGDFFGFPLWLIILVPLFLLTLANIIPYFLGVKKHQVLTKLFLTWRLEFLGRMRVVVSLPESDHRNKLIDFEKQTLDSEIDKMHLDNSTFSAIKMLKMSETEKEDLKAEYPEAYEVINYLNNHIEDLSKWDIKLYHSLQIEEFKEGLTLYKASELNDYLDTTYDLTEKKLDSQEKITPYYLGMITSLLAATIGFLLKQFKNDIFEFFGFFLDN